MQAEKEAAEKKAIAAEQQAQQARSDLEEAKSSENAACAMCLRMLVLHPLLLLSLFCPQPVLADGLRQRAAVPGEGEPDVTDDKDEQEQGGVRLPLWQLVALVVIFYMLGYFS